MRTRIQSPTNTSEAASFSPVVRERRSALQNRAEPAVSDRRPAGLGHHFGQIQVYHTAPAGIQTKRTVNEPGDKYEREADRVADQVMRMTEPAQAGDADFPERTPGLGIQRKCSQCEGNELQLQPIEEEEEELQMKPLPSAGSVQRQPIEEEEEEIQRQPIEEEEELQAKERSGEVPEVNSRTQRQIESFRNGGQSLSQLVRNYFEPRFGVDLGAVRIHTEPQAAQAAHDLRARAFTRGWDIAFASGQFTPNTFDGRKLLAHELTHTLQQNSSVNALPADSALAGRNARADQVDESMGGPLAPVQAPPIHSVRSTAPVVQRAPATEQGEPEIKTKSFAAIYDMLANHPEIDVHEKITAPDLSRLEENQLLVLDSMVERKIAFFSDLAKQQAADPKFSPPAGYPDIMWSGAVISYKKFQKILDPYTQPIKRARKAPDLIDAWMEKLRAEFDGEPMQCAIDTSLQAARNIVDLKLAGKEFSFNDWQILNFGYLDKEGAAALLTKTTLEGDTPDEKVEAMGDHIIKKIRERRTILPLRMANQFLQAGSGDPENIPPFVIQNFRDIHAKEIDWTLLFVAQKRVGNVPWDTSRDTPGKAIFSWFLEVSHDSHYADSVYSCYKDTIFDLWLPDSWSLF